MKRLLSSILAIATMLVCLLSTPGEPAQRTGGVGPATERIVDTAH
jgi:hypothetical protein